MKCNNHKKKDDQSIAGTNCQKKKKKKTIALLHATIAKNKTNAMLHATIAKIRWLLCYMQQSQKIKMNALLDETIAKQMHWSQWLCHQKTIALRYATIANASIVQQNATIIKRWLFCKRIDRPTKRNNHAIKRWLSCKCTSITPTNALIVQNDHNTKNRYVLPRGI